MRFLFEGVESGDRWSDYEWAAIHRENHAIEIVITKLANLSESADGRIRIVMPCRTLYYASMDLHNVLFSDYEEFRELSVTRFGGESEPEWSRRYGHGGVVLGLPPQMSIARDLSPLLR